MCFDGSSSWFTEHLCPMLYLIYSPSCEIYFSGRWRVWNLIRKETATVDLRSEMTRPNTRVCEWMFVLWEAGRWWVGAGWGHSYCLACHGWATPAPLGGPKGPRGQAVAMSPQAPRPWEPQLWSMSAVSLGTLGATDWAIWSREQRPWHTAVTRGRHAETWTRLSAHVSACASFCLLCTHM